MRGRRRDETRRDETRRNETRRERDEVRMNRKEVRRCNSWEGKGEGGEGEWRCMAPKPHRD